MSPDIHSCSAIHDFDFLIGSWRTRQRRLAKRLQGDDSWESFEATSTVVALPGGIANMDVLSAEAWRPGWIGQSFRFFNPATNLWSIHWVTNDGGGIDAASGRLEPPVVGRFDGDVGIFEGDDVYNGRPIRVRFRWRRLGPDAARWEQSFSPDGGSSWELNWVMEFERTAAAARLVAAPAIDFDCAVVELRQYTLHPGRRDELIDLFDREFVETQEAEGLAVMGQFRDLDAADRFVWLRGFAGMDQRARGLAAFYGGPVWQQHRNAANATMIDSDDVRLLRPAWPGAGIDMRARMRPLGPLRQALPGLLLTLVLPLREPASPELLRCCRDVMVPALERGGAECLGWYVSESAPNNFPRLPVREGEPVLVGLAMFATLSGHAAFAAGGAWQRHVAPLLEPWLAAPMQSLRLVATARSAIHF